MDTVAIVSVISSAVVAVSGVAFPLIYQYLRSKDIKKDKRKKEVNQAAIEFLQTLGLISGPVSDYGSMPPFDQMSQLVGNYYAWERAVWVLIGEERREVVAKVRTEVEASDYRFARQEQPKWSKMVLETTAMAIEAIE